MGRAKELLTDRLEIQRDIALAPFIGLTVDELSDLTYEVTEDSSKDGLIYQLIVTFDDESPKKLLSKVKGLENGNIVFVPPYVFDTPDLG